MLVQQVVALSALASVYWTVPPDESLAMVAVRVLPPLEAMQQVQAEVAVRMLLPSLLVVACVGTFGAAPAEFGVDKPCLPELADKTRTGVVVAASLVVVVDNMVIVVTSLAVAHTNRMRL